MLPEFAKARVLLDAGDVRQAEELLRRGLLIEPRDIEANHRFGLLLLESGRAAEAVKHLELAVSLDGGGAERHNHLGVALAELGRFEESLALLRRAAELAPRVAQVFYNQGNVLRQLGRLDEAIAAYRSAVQIDPQLANAHYNMGNTLQERGHLRDAIACYEAAIRATPDYLGAYNNLASILREQGKLAEAEKVLEAALKVRGDFAEGRFNLALLLLEQKKTDAALRQLREVLRIRPEFAKARETLGEVLAQKGEPNEAVALLEEQETGEQKTVASELRTVDALWKSGRHEEAGERLERLLAADPTLVEAHYNLGLVRLAQDRLEESIACYRRALELKPDLADAHSNLASLLRIRGDEETAAIHLQRCLFHNPASAQGRMNHAGWLLRNREFAAGWLEFEWRRLTEKHRPREYSVPRWDGSRLEGRTVLLHAEQGLGDTIQFVRYAQLARERCGRIVLECPAALRPLLRACPGVDQLVANGEALPEHHAHLPLMSLPLVLGIGQRDLVTQSPYLTADPELEASWRKRLAAHGGLRIGIAWQGNPQYAGDVHRSIALRHFAPLAELPGVTLISLQKGKGIEQLAELSPPWPIVDLSTELDIAHGAFVDSAAILRNIDLMVTSDSAIAHLAGALGVPTWVAISRNADWRWFADGDDCPWYPTMRLFRQERLGDWKGCFAALPRPWHGCATATGRNSYRRRGRRGWLSPCR